MFFDIWANCSFRVPLIVTQLLLVAPLPNERDPCGVFQPRILNDTTGSFVSPGFPAHYPDNQDCSWLLLTDETHAIQITVENFTTQAE